MSKFPIWKTVTLGTMSKDALIPAFAALAAECTSSHLEVSSLAEDMIKQPGFSVSQRPTTVNLVKVNSIELELNTSAYTAVCAKAQKLQLMLCLPEVGPQLFLQYIHNSVRGPLGIFLENAFVAADPIVSRATHRGGDRNCIFTFQSQGVYRPQELGGHEVDDWDITHLGFDFIFCSP